MTIRTTPTEEVDLGKRRLFTIFQNSKVKTKPESREAARPPYAVAESLYLRICNGCGECVTKCPNNLIHVTNGLAEIDVSYSECTVCGMCKSVCPTLALSGNAEDTGLTATISSTCDNVTSYCDNCADSCVFHALLWQEYSQPTLDSEKCIGCGACTTSCFISAIQMTLM